MIYSPENFKTTTADCTEFITQGITNICNTYGPRPCGSESEKNAQEQMMKELESFCDGDFMMIYEKDMTGMVKNDKDVCALLKNAALKQGEDIPVGAIPLGSTDAAAASQAGIKAASLVAMDPAPAQYYHTRLDKAEILIPEVIDKVLNIVLQAVCDFDENGI